MVLRTRKPTADQDPAKQEATEEKGRIPPTADELATAYSGPAHYVDKTMVTGQGTSVRLSFIERDPNGRVHFRAAVVMSVDQMIKLKEVLQRVEDNMEVIEVEADKLDG